jgi:hypothetical protein
VQHDHLTVRAGWHRDAVWAMIFAKKFNRPAELVDGLTPLNFLRKDG